MNAPARWVELVQRPEAEVPLDEAALLISASANPALDVAAQLGRLDELGGRVGRPELGPLIGLVYGELGVAGNRDGYYDPANSYLDQVLDRRLGIPISMAVLLIEIGRRAGVRLEAVGMPGHFLVRDPARADQLIDPFEQGRRLDRPACEELLQAATGQATRLTPEMLAPTGAHSILARMLANLDRCFELRQDRRSLSWVCDLRIAVPGAAPTDRTQLAGRLATLGRFDSAADLLEQVAGRVGSERVQSRLMEQASAFRARLN